MTFWSPNKFCISFIIWQTSKITWTFAFGICGWGNQVWMLDKSSIQPSWVAVLWLPNVPSKTNAVTNKSSWCSKPMQSLISWAWTDAEILFCREVTNWMFPMTCYTTNHENQCFSCWIITSLWQSCAIINSSNIAPFLLIPPCAPLCNSMASTISTTSDIWGFVLATFPTNLMTSQKKPGSQFTYAAQDLMVDECGKKNTLCTNSYAFGEE